MTMNSPSFDLTRFDVSELGSISALFAAKGLTSGLYVLHFANNEAYAGRSLDVAARFLDDRREWSDIEFLEFTSWPADDAERALAELQELLTRTAVLRARTAQTSDAVAGPSPFPSDRSERITITNGATTTSRARFWELSDHIAYQDIRSIVADYINASISDPANTARYLWNVTALPSTAKAEGRRRLLTLNCGSLETLFVTEYTNDDDDSIELVMTVNTDIPAGYSDTQLEFANDVVTAARGEYKSHDVWSWQIDIGALLSGDAEVDFGVADDVFDDLAYSLNTRLMNQKGSPYARYHNNDLANDIVAEAYRQLLDAE